MNRSSPRRVAVVTGTRAEYGLLRSTIGAIAAHPRLELQLVVTGMHLVRACGYTVREIERDPWPIAARVRMQRGDDSRLDQAEGLARGVAGMARAFASLRSEITLVLGDRIEALAGGLAGLTTGCAVAHLHGGDVAPGDFDDALRHALTKLAHIHLVASRDAAARVRRLGEESARIHVVGAPALDEIRAVLAEPPPQDEPRDTAIVVVHAHGRSAEREHAAARAILRAVAAAGLRCLVIHPNTDRGRAGVLRAIDEFARAARAQTRLQSGAPMYEQAGPPRQQGGAPTRPQTPAQARAQTRPPPRVEVVRSLRRAEYLRRLRGAAVLIGNSSSGVIEAPLLGTPAVDVGNRQAGRLAAGPLVVRAAESERSIRAALARALTLPRRPARRTPYGDGRAGERIARILASLRIDERLLRKVITY